MTYEEFLQSNKNKMNTEKRKKVKGHKQYKSRKKTKMANNNVFCLQPLIWVRRWKENYCHSLLIEIKIVQHFWGVVWKQVPKALNAQNP